VNASGLVTAVGQGTTTITATLDGGGGPVAGNATVTVESSGTGVDVQSMTIIPAAGFQVLTNPGETAQFIAIGSFNTSPNTQDVTSQVAWQSSDVRVATINSAGLATAVGCGPGQTCKTQITAIATTTNGSKVFATSDLTVEASGSVTLPSLTIYMVGLGTGSVTSNPPGINCTSPGGAACTGHFVLGSNVTLTATAPGFGGWSSNCQPANSTTCSVTVGNNDTVGVIFNSVP
jgi:trimeric autotransporter adhesin